MKRIFILAVISLTISALAGMWLFNSQGRAAPGAVSLAAFPSISLEPYASGLSRPVFITHAGDGSGRLFIVEQSGVIRIAQNGSLLGAPFLDITDRVYSPANGGGNEEGLLSVAFPPGNAQKQHFYVYYTNADGNNVVARFQVTADPNLADPQSETQILLIEHPGQNNHNGGQLAFGPDGYLYIGAGDGGGGGDPNKNAQNPASLLGKLLRIDVEYTPPSPPPGAPAIYLPCIANHASSQTPPAPAYRIPPDNPFVNTPGYRPEIWALGLRNPWRFSFDRQTGDLYIGDVGQNAIEEIDYEPSGSPGGLNYGWNILEGENCYNPQTQCTPPANYAPPVASYPHGTNDSNGCSVTGGFIYRGAAVGLQGVYLFADYCTGRIWGLQNDGGWQTQQLLDTDHNISTFGEDESGEMYVADMSSGEVFRVSSP